MAPNLDLGPRWSPVDDRIAFFSDRNGGSAVYTVRSDGTQIARIEIVKQLFPQARIERD